MSENGADYKGKRERRAESSHFRVVPSKMRLTPWGVNSKNLQYVKQMLHLESLEHRTWRFDGICVKFSRPSGSGAILFFKPLWR
jgi:hypothetical protein